MRTLLTFTGFHDPFTMGLVGDDEQPGPILSLIAVRPFDRVVLFSTPRAEANSRSTLDAIRQRHPSIEVDVRELALEDPTDYAAILKQLREHYRELNEGSACGECFIAVASGTPQMHACWLMLAASGEIPAHILNVRPPRFVTRERSLVDEVDLSLPWMPEIRSGIDSATMRGVAGAMRPDEFMSASVPAPDPEAILQDLGMVADHPSMRKALEEAAALAPSSAPVIIQGETGTGKELLAKFIHRLSGRPRECFVPVNCSAIPKDLVESSLFGHKKGAFTGATRDQVGKFVLADGGTLFLDEIGELPVAAQAKLLRVLDDGKVEPVGAEAPQEVDVRVVAATNRDLPEGIHAGEFREDLYYRLAVGDIQLPPLRKRPSDIPKIALLLLDRLNSNLRRRRRLAPDALRRLQTHSWPGNVRDLQNTLERSVMMSSADVLQADDLIIRDIGVEADPLSSLPEPHEGFSLESFLGTVRKQLLLRALEITGGNRTKAGLLLGISAQAVSKFAGHQEGS
ncbi:MAG: sigma 54-interacting transcriptional regulator [Candidatus Eisenbacteria sp.]|nr:sigma 54-interacting transcriptional regulator [Candidatus Eisenbacteria bacterium]